MGYMNTSPKDLKAVALGALADVAGDPNAPANARVQAAVALLNLTGTTGTAGDAIGDLDLPGLDAEIARLAGDARPPAS